MSSDRRLLLLGGGIVVALTALVSVLGYPSMPAEMATHWNASGEVDGTMPRAFALALLPAIAAATLAFFAVIPRVDPRDGYEEFRASYDLLAVATVAFVGYAHVLVVLANAGYEFELLAALSPGIGAIYVLGGYVTDRTEQNWFVGARTPWTLEDEAVWTDTNHLVARVLQVGGVVAALGALAPDFALALILAPVVLAFVVTVGYSYYRYQQTA